VPTTRFARFALPGELEFNPGPGTLGSLHIRNELASATICLQGAQLTAWRPRSAGNPVIWTSPSAQATAGKSLRGGVPVCWPWFGPHATQSTLPAHGFVRGLPWEVCASGRAADGATEVTLAIGDSEQTRAAWPHAFLLELQVRVGATLEMSLVTRNTGLGTFSVSEALHTYFAIGDIAAARVHGLEEVEFLDKTRAGDRRVEHQPIAFDGEIDRVYCNTSGDCTIEDPVLGRRIRISKTDSRSTVVWNPWDEKSRKMGDLGPGRQGEGGWRDMVCVESGNVGSNEVSVLPGALHRMAVRYSVEAL